VNEYSFFCENMNSYSLAATPTTIDYDMENIKYELLAGQRLTLA